MSRAEHFWNNHVLARVVPDNDDGSPASLQVLKHLRRVPEKTVDVTHMLFDLYAYWYIMERQAKRGLDLAKRWLIESMGDAEAAESGEFSATYFEQSRGASAADESKFRVLRFNGEFRDRLKFLESNPQEFAALGQRLMGSGSNLEGGCLDDSIVSAEARRIVSSVPGKCDENRECVTDGLGGE